ncbi:MAG: ATP-cone domain protein [Microgenomates group bacterium GW2011_GWA2_46_16]|nr:MAG: ATP-cone domain protein [Microgenomates group bacterium GW2011_GWA2_46_16]
MKASSIIFVPKTAGTNLLLNQNNRQLIKTMAVVHVVDKGSTMIQVKKASGDLEPFSEEKVTRSLLRAGTDTALTDKIVAHVEKELYDGIPTHKIYSHIFELLKREQSPLSGRYNLKKAIMDLGPTGYPFEKFVAALLQHNGYQVETGVEVRGHCVAHEIDVIAQKDDQRFMVECKFHNQPGTRSDVKVALYIKARFDDVKATFHQAWLVTNTKLTSDAIQYGECAGMKLIGWSYPSYGSLQDLIEGSGLHPVTCLTSLSQNQKQILLSSNIVLCRDVATAKQEILSSLALSDEQKTEVFAEIGAICHVNP